MEVVDSSGLITDFHGIRVLVGSAVISHCASQHRVRFNYPPVLSTADGLRPLLKTKPAMNPSPVAVLLADVSLLVCDIPSGCRYVTS